MADKYRPLFKGVNDEDRVLKIIPQERTLLEQFAGFAETKGVPMRWYYIDISAPLIINQLQSLIVRDVLGYNQFFKMLNRTDNTVKEALKALSNGAKP